MNFITRNLGWFLLLLFFLFMLFVISSNNGTKNEATVTGSSVISDISHSGAEDLDTLVKMIDEEESTKEALEEVDVLPEIVEEEKEKWGIFSFLGWWKDKNNMKADNDVEETNNEELLEREDDSIDEDKIVGEVLSETSIVKEELNKEVVTIIDTDTGAISEGKQGFFSKLFWKDEEEKVTEEWIVKFITESDGTQEQWESLVKETWGTLISTTSYANIKKYAPEVLAISDYPGVNLKTEIGKDFEIWVHSLKLNNAYFNETLAYMKRGDRVKQLTNENVHGCFMIEILDANNENNIWKTGYVCKKYLQEKGEYVIEEKIAVEKVFPVSNIGDLITIEVPSVTFGEGIVLIKWDIIDQASATDSEGCFDAHVLSSQNIQYIVPVGNICYSDIK